MTSNHKLTAVLRGRTITGTQSQNNRLIIVFNDGSKMTVKTSGPITSVSAGSTIAKVRQQDTGLALGFEDGSTMEIQLAEATSSVMLRDKGNTLEYVD